MLEVRIPKEITEYKEKILFGLSWRQLLCFAIAIGLGVVSYLLLLPHIGADAASYIVIIEVIPVFAVGFVRKNGFTFEKYVAMILRHMFITRKRKYKTNIKAFVSEKKRKEGGTLEFIKATLFPQKRSRKNPERPITATNRRAKRKSVCKAITARIKETGAKGA